MARAVRDAVASPKINYEIHGNTIPHLHLHVFPRYPGDPFTAGPINAISTNDGSGSARKKSTAGAVRTIQSATEIVAELAAGVLMPT